MTKVNKNLSYSTRVSRHANESAWEGGKLETCESEISVRIESRIESAATIRIRIESWIESADSRLQLQC